LSRTSAPYRLLPPKNVPALTNPPPKKPAELPLRLLLLIVVVLEALARPPPLPVTVLPLTVQLLSVVVPGLK